MLVSEHIARLRGEGGALAAAAASAGLGTPVPSCPEWVVRDLVRHQGGVHRWATGVVTGALSEPWDVDLDEVVGRWPSDAGLLSWFADGHRRLVEALEEADPDLSCWTFLAAPSPLAMWARRQAHETTVHRVDAELAAGGPVGSVPAPFAADGVDELLACFLTRSGGSVRADPPRTLLVGCSDTPGRWLVRIGPDGVATTGVAGVPGADTDAPRVEDTDCQVSGEASALYLTLWGRPGATDPPTVTGDRRVLDAFVDDVDIRWS